ncbi:hypothetical protein P280DRAFT_509902, partial [Massarina eburnea CBS 473.64]
MDNDRLASASRHKEVLRELGHREPSTVLQAQAVLESIRSRKGYLDETTLSHLESLPEDSRRRVLDAVARTRELEGRFTRSISEDLYPSNYRFIYERLQNADSLKYTKVQARGEGPFVRFTATPKTFVIETNEDGFTRANVEAMCAMDENAIQVSASDDNGGKEGSGFKAVFAVADEVHIQSGVWSFQFKHHRGEDGLGMVTPLDTPPESLPPGTSTRITLMLSETTRNEYHRLVGAITEIPSTTILFLRRLQRVETSVTQLDSRLKKTVICKNGTSIMTSHGYLYPDFSPEELRTLDYDQGRRFGDQEGHTGAHGTVSISRTTTQIFDQDKQEETDETAYHVFTHIVEHMPDRSTAKIDIAFPVDIKEGQPKMSELGQHIFAHLPIQRLPQFQFLVQSDFITTASGAGIVRCAWNSAIRDGVAKAFASAIASFATAENALRYSWLDFLPAKPMKGYWEKLYPSIIQLLRRLPILQSWEGRHFSYPSQLYRLDSIHLHNGNPIFRDINENNVYLAPDYKTDHHWLLAQLGVGIISWESTLRRVMEDIARPDSRIKTLPPHDEWHQACAALLILPFSHPEFEQYRRMIQSMTLIPLSNGRSWTRAPDIRRRRGLRAIYFPKTDGVPIPKDIDLHLVEDVAASDPHRRALFETMGVKKCPKQTVLSRIEEYHGNLRGTFDLYSHFRYLYNFHPRPESVREWIRVPAENGYKKPTTTPLYFPSDQRYDTQGLLPLEYQTKDNNLALFIQKDLVELVGPEVQCQGLSWKVWLQRATGARYHPPLLQPSKSSSNEVSRIMTKVLGIKSELFLGTLKEHWDGYKSDAERILPQLKDCKVQCDTDSAEPLHTTFLPTIEIKSRIQDLGVASKFPLLRLPDVECLDETAQQEWHFLEKFGVRRTIDLEFYKRVLDLMSAKPHVNVSTRKVTEVYNSMASLARVQDEDDLRSFFNTSEAIALAMNSDSSAWFKLDKCLWNGPEFLNVKFPLKHQYGNDAHLETFFDVFLVIEVNGWTFSRFQKRPRYTNTLKGWPKPT